MPVDISTIAISLLLFSALAGNAGAGQSDEWPPWDYGQTAKQPANVDPEIVPAPERLAVSGLFRIYKGFIGPANGFRCPMHPSCSSYALAAIDKWGLFRGVVLSSDRLIRCGCNLDQYAPADWNGSTVFGDPMPGNNDAHTQ
jgi:putative component of membrane protein insertase Oxa1/YidC/SpoIIIJ protein YidD